MHALSRRPALTRFAHLSHRYNSSQECTGLDVRPNAGRGRPRRITETLIPAHPENAKLLKLLEATRPNGTVPKSYIDGTKSVASYPLPIRTLQDVENLRIVDLQKIHLVDYVKELEHSSKSGPSSATVEVSLDRAKRKALLFEALRALPHFGNTTAYKIVTIGCENIEELRRDNLLQRYLTRRQKEVLAWYNYVLQPIPRESIDTTIAFFESFLKSEQWEVIGTGDYRRGKKFASQMDILCIHPSHGYLHLPSQPHNDRKRRKEIHAITDARLLDLIRSRGGLAGEFDLVWSKWEGVIRVPERLANGDAETWKDRIENIKQRKGIFHHAQIRMVSSKSKGAALLCTTGDPEYVKYVTNEASKLGMVLNEYGLWQFHSNDDSLYAAEVYKTPGKRTKRLLSQLTNGYWELLPSDTEEQILDHLGLPYVEPDMRNFANIKT